MADFYDLFFKECTQYFEICKSVEKELLLINFPEPFVNIDNEEIPHSNDRSVFLKHVEEKIGKEIDKRKQILNETRYVKSFLDSISEKRIEKMEKHLNGTYSQDDCRLLLFTTNFFHTYAVRKGEGKIRGLRLPCYNIKTVKDKKEYDIKEMFRILSSYDSMRGKNKITDTKKFFNTYVKYLSDRFKNINSSKIQKIKQKMKDLIKGEEANIKNMNEQYYRKSSKTPESELSNFYESLDVDFYSDAYESYYFFRIVLSKENKKQMDEYFIELNIEMPISDEIKKDAPDKNTLFLSDLQCLKEYNYIRNDNYIQEKYNNFVESLKKLANDPRLEELVIKHVKTSSKRNIKQEKAREIKQKLVLALLKEHLITNETINEIRDVIKREYETDLNELSHLLIIEDARNHHSWREKYMDYLMSFSRNVQNDRDIYDEVYKNNLLEVIEIKRKNLEELKR